MVAAAQGAAAAPWEEAVLVRGVSLVAAAQGAAGAPWEEAVLEAVPPGAAVAKNLLGTLVRERRVLTPTWAGRRGRPGETGSR